MARMSKADWQLVREAINHAIEERDGYRGAHLNDYGETHPDNQAIVDRCDRFIMRAEAFCQKHFGRASDIKRDNERLAALPTVSIFDIPSKEQQQ